MRQPRNRRISPAAVAGFKAGDEEALLAALGIGFGKLNPLHIDDDGDMNYDLKKFPSMLFFGRKFWDWADAGQIGKPPIAGYDDCVALRKALVEAAKGDFG